MLGINPTTKKIPEVLPLACPEYTSSDEEIAQCDTIAFNATSQGKISDMEFNNYKVVRSVENIENQDINNLPCMDIIENQSILTNYDLLDISTNELLNNFSTDPIMSEYSTAFSVISLVQPETNIELNTQITLNLTPNADLTHTCHLAEKHVSEGITTCLISDVNSTVAGQSNIIILDNEPSTSTISISENDIENNANDNEIAHHGDLSNRKRKSTVNKDTTKWKRFVNRDLRMKGEKYLGNGDTTQ